jgi:hypothetical protein
LTRNERPATTAVPERDLPEVGPTVTETDAGPVPAAGESDSQGTLLTAVHGQAAVVAIAIGATAPAGPASSEGGEIA